MSKLSDIIDAAATDSDSVAGLLRKVKVLASRIENPPLIDWVENELSGYSTGAQVPSYRGPFKVNVSSEWMGLGSIAKNVSLAEESVPEGMRNIGAFEIKFYEAIAELERHAQQNDPVVYFWPSSAAVILNRQMKSGSWPEIYPGYGLVRAWKTVSPARCRAVVDNVRTRVLNLALQLEKVAPDAGEKPGLTTTDPTTINQIITNIFGHGNSVAYDSPGASQISVVGVSDLQSLLDAVGELGLKPEEVAELKQAIEADESDDGEPKGEPGSRVAKFLGRLTLGTLKTAGQEGVKEVTKQVGDMVLAYYGIK